MQKRVHRVFMCVRERTSVSYAKIATMGGLCDVDLIITKATCHDDAALPERYVHELLKIFNISPTTYSTFALSFARRFRKTRSWRVALKCLLLLHRLLCSLSNDGPLRAELLWARTNGTLSLYPCNFRDCTSSASDDYTAFVRAYARLLDEALDYVVIELKAPIHAHTFFSSKGDDDEGRRQSQALDTPRQSSGSASHDGDNNEDNADENVLEDLGRTIQVLPQLQSLIDRAIDCWPVGAASRSFLVQSAMKHVIRDSIWRYAAFRREIEKVLENLIQMPYRSCVASFGIYKRAAAQAEELSRFHEWCKSMGYCGSYEYPFIDRIPAIQIRAMENFLDGMWQLTDRSSDTNVSDVSSGEDSSGGEIGAHEETEVEPLIKWEDEESAGWEELLEASINGNACWRNEWQMEVYNPYGFQTPNPFYRQPNITNYGSCPNTPLQHHHTWLEVHDATATCA